MVTFSSFLGLLVHPLQPWSSMQPTGFCPIAVGEVLRRLISRIGCAAAKSQVPALSLLSGQVGVGVSDRLDAAIHRLRVFLTDHGADEDLCCLKVDMANAFNACSREALLHRTREHLPELFSAVVLYLCYTCVGELRFGSHRIGSSAGVQQGDPLVRFCFRWHCWSLLRTSDNSMASVSVSGTWMMEPSLAHGEPFARCWTAFL